MRFLLLNQFYPPDVAPTGRYLHDLARSLVQRGHHVQVLCSRRSYDGTGRYSRREILDGVAIIRLPATGFGRRGFLGKIADYSSFYLSLLSALLLDRNPPDVILALTTPPYIGALAKLAALRHQSRHAHWIMDLYPDVLLAHGLKRNRALMRLLQHLTRFQFEGASQVLTLGPAMADRAAAYLPARVAAHDRDDGNSVPPRAAPAATAPRAHWFPLWSEPALTPWPDSEPNPLRTARNWTPDDLVLLYSGNMGLGHRFGEFLEAARRLGPSGPRWVFAGGGKRRAEVEAVAKSLPEARIDLMGYVPNDSLRAHLCAADVHLVSLDSAWQGFMVPSKLQGSFAVGRPVIYVGGRHCETATWILESGGGWVVDENDIEGLLAAVRQAQAPEERHRRGQAALEFARTHFQMSLTCTRIAELLEGAYRLSPIGYQNPVGGPQSSVLSPVRSP